MDSFLTEEEIIKELTSITHTTISNNPSIDELNRLILNTNNREEKLKIVDLYNKILAIRQRKVIAEGKC